MPIQTLRSRGKIYALFFAAGIGLTLASGFIPLAFRFSEFLPFNNPLYKILFFPLFAFIFAFSLPKEKKVEDTTQLNLFRISMAPIIIAILFGIFQKNEIFWSRTENIVWYLIAIPVGEELLFREWLFRLSFRIWGRQYFSLTNPLPVTLIVTSIAFSLWHLQNFGFSNPLLVTFQIFYTFFTGIWLGLLRWKTHSLTPCIFAHFLINLASNIF